MCVCIKMKVQGRTFDFIIFNFIYQAEHSVSINVLILSHIMSVSRDKQFVKE